MEFRSRDYRAEEHAAALPRLPAHQHPLASPSLPSSTQADVVERERVEFDDPLRVHITNAAAESVSDHSQFKFTSSSFSSKEWTVFSTSLLQRFSYTNRIPMSASLDIAVRSSKDVHREELDDPEMLSEDEKKVITRQEYASRLQQLKAEIRKSWRDDDRIKALKLSIKVAKLLMDTTVSQFYPTLFILVIEVLDMLGDLVWERIRRKAEYSDDGTLLCSLPENFVAGDICSEAKDTCYNWFCKIGSIRELLPRIYLELAIIRCWRFLGDNHLDNLRRLTMMMRGLADPLASTYCHLYMTRCAESLNPGERGYLIASISDMSIQLGKMIMNRGASSNHSQSIKFLMILMEPAVEWIMKCIFTEGYKKPVDVLVEFGFWPGLPEPPRKIPCISLVLHHLLKQLPAEFISINALHIIELFEKNNDASKDQHLNYRLLGLKLSESPPPLSSIKLVLNHVLEVINQYNCLEEYLIVADSYIDLILQCSEDDCLLTIFDGILKRGQSIDAGGTKVDILQSILSKLINHFDLLEDVFSLNNFMEILQLLRGSSRNMVNMQLLKKAKRTGSVSNPTTIQFLFEISLALHDSIDISDMDDGQQKSHLISSFVRIVDFGIERDRHLNFLIECRAAFGHINELTGTLVHLSNNLAVKAIKSMNKFVMFLKACIAFSEVTVPSISDSLRRMHLYLETAEVALLGGLISHTEGLISSAISCSQSLNVTTDFEKAVVMDQLLSFACKLCSILVMVPGTHDEGITYFPRVMMSAFDCQSLTSPSNVKILCSIISLLASLSQDKQPYHTISLEVLSNYQLFYGDASYYQELLSLSNLALQRLFILIEEEPCSAIRGKMALDACNYLIVSFKKNNELSMKCAELLDIAKSCLHSKDKYLESTVSLFDKHFSNL